MKILLFIILNFIVGFNLFSYVNPFKLTEVPENISIGNTGVSYLKGVNGLLINPGLINGMEKNEILLLYNYGYSESYNIYAGFLNNFLVGKDKIFGIDFVYSGFNTDFELRDNDNNFLGGFNVTFWGAGITYGIKFGKINSGIKLKYIQNNYLNIGISVISADIGINYFFDGPDISTGLCIKNIDYASGENGLSFKPDINFGLSKMFIKNRLSILTEFEYISYLNIISINLGIRYELIKNLSLGGGISYKFFNNQDWVDGLGCGLSYIYKNIKFGYGMKFDSRQFNNSYGIHSISVNYYF